VNCSLDPFLLFLYERASKTEYGKSGSKEVEMNWFLGTMTLSIFKKLLMAFTGLVFCSFLCVHLMGNLVIYSSPEAFNAYSERLHSLGALISLAELGLLVCAAVHVSLGALLFYENVRARPVRYVMKKNAGGRTLSSSIMPYTGLYLLIFVIIHLFTFHFVDRTGQTLYQIVAGVFSKPGYVVFYVFSVAVAAFHVKHGLWSAFQSLGANHPKYMALIRGASLVFSLIVVAGFGSIPLFVLSSIR
jgi:succinate dehydrogenase / fumarate reductase cytochrome b subunit